MLCRETAAGFTLEANRLIGGPKWNNSRTLRRFLDNVVNDRGEVHQTFACAEGYDARQLAAIHRYACEAARDEELRDCVSGGILAAGTQLHGPLGIVANVYELPASLERASLKQLQAAVLLVAFLGAQLEQLSRNPSDEAGFEDYRYRGLPCSIAPDNGLWTVSGEDVRTRTSGVLEWCFNEDDARHVLDAMSRFPDRFKALAAQAFAKAFSAQEHAVASGV